MKDAVCPSCRAVIRTVQPVRIPADPDSLRWKGRIPPAMGYICPQCSVLLPLVATQERDDA